MLQNGLEGLGDDLGVCLILRVEVVHPLCFDRFSRQLDGGPNVGAGRAHGLRLTGRAIEGSVRQADPSLDLPGQFVADWLRVRLGYPLADLRLHPGGAAVSPGKLSGAALVFDEQADVCGACGLGVHGRNAPDCYLRGKFPKRY